MLCINKRKDQSHIIWLPHLYSSLDAGLNNGACALNVYSFKQRTVIAARGWRGTVEDQGHILQSWQQSLQRDNREKSQLLTAAAPEERLVQANLLIPA